MLRTPIVFPRMYNRVTKTLGELPAGFEDRAGGERAQFEGAGEFGQFGGRGGRVAVAAAEGLLGVPAGAAGGGAGDAGGHFWREIGEGWVCCVCGVDRGGALVERMYGRWSVEIV